MTKQGKELRTHGEIVKLLNNQFKSVFEKNNGEIPDVSDVRERVSEKNSEWGVWLGENC